MKFHDVFNGDADGLCALHQLRLAEPRDAKLITGVKRDIALLRQVDAQPGDQVTVLDIAVEKNLDALHALLQRGVEIRWFDHHNPGEIPVHPGLQAHIDTTANVCTALLVNRALAGRYLPWAVVAAFGDNLHDAAREAAAPLGYSAAQLQALRELGECLNYNGYGETPADLFFHPADLYRRVHDYADPFAFLAESHEFRVLREGYATDMAQARAVVASETNEAGSVIVLPEMPWARRVIGVYANELATAHPTRAHALLLRTDQGHYVVSVRAPLNNRSRADELCKRFATGGGRKAAAGINCLPETDVPAFCAAFFATYSNP